MDKVFIEVKIKIDWRTFVEKRENHHYENLTCELREIGKKILAEIITIKNREETIRQQNLSRYIGR